MLLPYIYTYITCVLTTCKYKRIFLLAKFLDFQNKLVIILVLKAMIRQVILSRKVVMSHHGENGQTVLRFVTLDQSKLFSMFSCNKYYSHKIIFNFEGLFNHIITYYTL